MLRISSVDSRTRLKLVLEGELVAPWVAELRMMWQKVRAELQDRKLVIELRNVTLVSQEGENALLELMNQGARFRCSGMFARQVIEQVARRSKSNPDELFYPARPHHEKHKE